MSGAFSIFREDALSWFETPRASQRVRVVSVRPTLMLPVYTSRSEHDMKTLLALRAQTTAPPAQRNGLGEMRDSREWPAMLDKTLATP